MNGYFNLIKCLTKQKKSIKVSTQVKPMRKSSRLLLISQRVAGGAMQHGGIG